MKKKVKQFETNILAAHEKKKQFISEMKTNVEFTQKITKKTISDCTTEKCIL